MPPSRIPLIHIVIAGFCLLLHGIADAGSAVLDGAQSAAPASSHPVSYRNDIVPIIVHAGCNMGACHGAATGKGELSLSFRGENPVRDHAAFLKQFIDLKNPDKSLMLRKASEEVKHGGGRRFDKNSESCALLRQWIAEGAKLDLPDEPTLVSLEASPSEKVLTEPENKVRISVTAHYSDGSKRDVNRWAIYEPTNLNVEVDELGDVISHQPGETVINIRYLGLQAPVRLAFVTVRPSYVWSDPPTNNFIDEALRAKWKLLRMNPSDLCDDTVFIRRAFLDLIGLIPTEKEARDFFADTAPDKRSKLIETLLQRPEFADYWALKWADLLRVEEKVLDRKGVAAFHHWIRESIAENKPIDQFTREILSSLGSTYAVAPANYYRALRTPEDRAEAVAQIFLGTRMNCAKCHNHPFEKWTMDDYYQFSAVFDGIDYDIRENNRFDKNDKNNFVGEQVVHFTDKRILKDPRDGKLPDLRFLGTNEPITPDSHRLDRLAQWLTSPDQPLFARVQVNRIWYHLMGRGIVDPVDDFRSTNPPSNPALLDALAVDFAKNKFDLRHTIRSICNSRAYQLSSESEDSNAEDETNFTHALPRRLSAEQLLDSISIALGSLPQFEGYDHPMRAAQLPGVQAIYRPKNPTSSDNFIKLFGKPPRLVNSDTERTTNTSLAQVFELTSGPTLNNLLSRKGNTLEKLLTTGKTPDAVIDSLYWILLSRPPDPEEREEITIYLTSAENQRSTLEDIAWALLNSKEFLLRR